MNDAGGSIQWVSYLGLALSVVPAVLAFTGVLSIETFKWCMAAGMLLWFGTAIFWIKPDQAT